jgi:hypothetical protein
MINWLGVVSPLGRNVLGSLGCGDIMRNVRAQSGIPCDRGMTKIKASKSPLPRSTPGLTSHYCSV